MAKIYRFPKQKQKESIDPASFDTLLVMGWQNGRSWFHFKGNRIRIFELFEKARSIFFSNVLHNPKHR